MIIGSGPNGLTAAIVMAAHGLRTLVLEGCDQPGGGLRTNELTLPGFQHDLCSAVHPTGFLSPIFRRLRLEDYGLEWVHPSLSAAHPLDDQPAPFLSKSVEETAAVLGEDRNRYLRAMQPLAPKFTRLLKDVLEPPGFDKDFFTLARFGMKGLLPANTLAKRLFKTEAARALFAGCAAHSILPFNKLGTGAVGLVFLLAGHAANWPMAKGGSIAIANSLLRIYKKLGVRSCAGT